MGRKLFFTFFFLPFLLLAKDPPYKIEKDAQNPGRSMLLFLQGDGTYADASEEQLMAFLKTEEAGKNLGLISKVFEPQKPFAKLEQAQGFVMALMSTLPNTPGMVKSMELGSKDASLLKRLGALMSGEKENTGRLAHELKYNADEKIYGDIMSQKERCLGADRMKDEGVANMYDALAVLAANKFCSISNIGGEQKYWLKAAVTAGAPAPCVIQLDKNVSGIWGGGNLSVITKKAEAKKIGWYSDWHKAKPADTWYFGTRAKNPDGFYEQALAAGICNENSIPGQKPVPFKDH